MKCVFLFDMDGVIVDSTSLHVEAWQHYLAGFGLAYPDLAERMLGKHNAELVADLMPDHALTPDAATLHGRRKEALYRELMAPRLQAQMVAGVAAFLERHADRPAGLATNAEPANVDFVLDQAGLRERFGAIVSGDDVPRPKPFPDVYRRAAELLGADPADCIVFEDSATGVASARAAGMRVVGLMTSVAVLDGVDLSIPNFLDPALERWLSRAFSQ